MTTIDLDLAPSKAKLARAREHLKALQAETTAGVKEEDTHAVRFSEVDPQTGWCSITLIPQKVQKPRLSVILGDVVHNLRCALDYVVTALADASQTKLSTKHEFPIFLDAGDYAVKVGSKTKGKPRGHLRRITHGLSIIEQWQPYNAKGDPRTDPLWGIYRFSNADKHREPATFLPVPVGSIGLEYDQTLSRIVDTRGVLEIEGWATDQEYVIGHARFDPPTVRNLRAKGEITLDVRFVTPPFGSDADLTITLGSLPGIVHHVATMLDTFSQL